MLDAYYKWSQSPKPLITGFVLSLILTLTAYFIVVEKYASGWVLMCLILGLGTVQAVVQLVCFLHVGIEAHPRWNLVTFLFMLLVLVVVIGGSLWIMYSLNYRMSMGH